MHKNLRRAFGVLVGAAAAAATFSPAAAAAAPLQACFVYVSPVGQAGWSYQHDLGRQALARALGDQVQTRFVEGVAEGADSERVMRDLAAQGCGLVFATSFGYLEPALRVAAESPSVKFEHAGGYKTSANLATYDARYYEARWLAGYVAGSVSRSGIAGYVAGFAVPEVVQGIDAFALGMRAANPKATVRVVWLDTWFDPAKERDAARSLIDQGADVLTHHSGSTAVAQAAQAAWRSKHVRVIAYPSDMRAYAPEAQVAAIVHRWGGLYTRLADSVMAGTWQPEPVWGGIASGLVDIAALDPALPADVREAVQARRQAIVEGRLKPFAGRLVDNTGRVRLVSGALDDARIHAMDWLVEGVVGSLPTR